MEYIERRILINLNKVFKYYNLNDLEEISKKIEINYSTIRSWNSYHRIPTLKTLDTICDKLFIPTYILFLLDLNQGVISNNINKTINNNTPKKLKYNLRKVYKDKNLNSWSEVEAFFSGLLSVETLKSYHRVNNPIVPPIKTLGKMSSYLGVEPYKLLQNQEGDNYESKNK